MTITTVIPDQPVYTGDVALRSKPDTFDVDAENQLTFLATSQTPVNEQATAMNNVATEMNATAATVNADKNTVTADKAIVEADKIAAAESAASALNSQLSANGNPLGNYASGLIFATHNDYTNQNGLFRLKASVTPPYATNATTYPNAVDDPNLAPWSDVDTLKALALALNVPREAILLAVAGQNVTSEIKYFHNPVDQKTYGRPSTVGDGEVIVSVISGILTTASDTYQLYLANQEAHNINTVDGLRSLSTPYRNVLLSGYHEKGDDAFDSHIFEWDSTSTEDDNGGTIIKLDSITTGRYSLKYAGAVNVKWFGVIYDDISEDANNGSRLRGILNDQEFNGGLHLYFPKGTCYFTSFTSVNVNLTISGDGRETTKLITTLGYGESGITVRNVNLFTSLTLKDITYSGTGTAEDLTGASGFDLYLVLDGKFENCLLELMDTCVMGAHVYGVNFDTMRMRYYLIGLRGPTPAELAANGWAADAVFADNLFNNVYFYDAAYVVGAEPLAISDTSFNSNKFINCTFAGAHISGIDLSNSYGGNSFYGCRIERMKESRTWIKLGGFNRFYGTVVYTDAVRNWWTLNNPLSDTWLFDITGQGNYIDDFSPEYVRNLVRLGPLSRNNIVTWNPAHGDDAMNTDYFKNPLIDLGENNVINIGATDSITGGSNAVTTKPVTNLFVGSNNQTGFTLSGLTQSHEPTAFEGGPYKNSSVYKYNAPTGSRVAYHQITTAQIGSYYTYSMWIAASDYTQMQGVEVVAGSDLGVSSSYARIDSFAVNAKWVRVSKTFKADSATMYFGFRMDAAIAQSLYVSLPQIVNTGGNQQDIIIGAYVPAIFTETTDMSPSKRSTKTIVDVVGDRAFDTEYINRSEKPMTINVIGFSSAANAVMSTFVNRVLISSTQQQGVGLDMTSIATVPPGGTYKVAITGTPTLNSWHEYI